MAVYYNEFDRHAAAWLRELMKDGLIPEGEVDERSIAEVQATDLRGFRAVHLFAGIGGWPYALRLAGWPDDRPVWTGSCPCQPYSAAGKNEGENDSRDLWPEMFRLVRECRPVVCFGEQVEGAVAHGWLDRVSADLEEEGYAVGSVVLGAHSVGAPHIRQRMYWVADAEHGRSAKQKQGPKSRCGSRDDACGLANAGSFERFRRPRLKQSVGASSVKRNEEGTHDKRSRSTSGLADSDGRESGNGDLQRSGEYGQWPADSRACVKCRDGKARRVEPGIFPLAHGIPGRVALLRGAGNAICPQTAAEFVKAWREVRE